MTDTTIHGTLEVWEWRPQPIGHEFTDNGGITLVPFDIEAAVRQLRRQHKGCMVAANGPFAGQEFFRTSNGRWTLCGTSKVRVRVEEEAPHAPR